MNLKKMKARMEPNKFTPQKIQMLFQLFSDGLKMISQKAMAGLQGLTLRTTCLAPASFIAPRYDPARIMVWMAASLVNLVFSSVDVRYMNTRKKDPITSTMAA